MVMHGGDPDTAAGRNPGRDSLVRPRPSLGSGFSLSALRDNLGALSDVREEHSSPLGGSAGRVCAGFPGRTLLRLRPPARCGLHPRDSCGRAPAVPKAPAEPACGPRARCGSADAPPMCLPCSARISPGRAAAPARAGTLDWFLHARRARRPSHKTFAVPLEPPSRTTGTVHGPLARVARRRAWPGPLASSAACCASRRLPWQHSWPSHKTRLNPCRVAAVVPSA
jgi:hypothetical protein